MKNKKLFAILTLVCFMFTLMPVAAFAADEVLSYTQKADDVYATIAMGDADYVVYSYDGVTEKTDWTPGNGEHKIQVTQFNTNGKGYIALVENNGTADAKDDVKVVTEYVTAAMVNNYTAAATSGAKADVSALVAKDGDQTIAADKVDGVNVPTGKTEGVTFILTAQDADRASASFAAQTLYIWAKDAAGNITSALNVPTGFEASAIEGVYVSKANTVFADKEEIVFTFARSGEFTVYAGYAAVATGGNVIDELSEIKVLSAAAPNTIKVTSASANPENYTAQLNNAADKAVDSVLGGLSIVPNNVMSDKQYVTIYGEDNKPLVGATVELSTNSGAIELNKETAVTNGLGQIDFKVAGSVEGTYEIEVSVDGVSWTIEVAVGNTNATYITLDKQPAAPQALYGTLDNDEITFVITDINGNVVKAFDAGMEGINTAAAEGVGVTNDDGKYIVLTEKPKASNLESEDLTLSYADGVWGLNGVKKDAEGTYTVKVILDNGAFATATWEVKKFQTPVQLVIGTSTNVVELGGKIGGELLYFDVNGVQKAADDARIAATGYAVQNVVGNQEFQLTAKDDEKYVGATITVTAVSEKYDLVAVKEFKVADGAVAINFVDKAADVNVNNKLEWNVVDSEGTRVALGDTFTKADIKYIVLDKPEGAKVSTNDATNLADLRNKGIGKLALTSNKVGNVTVQVVVKAEYASTNNQVANQVKYYTGTQIFAVGTQGVGDVVVMSIGSNEIVINDAKATIDAAPIVENNRTFVPFRALAEAFGATVAYDEATQAVTAELNGVTVVMTIGSSTYTINGEEAAMDVAPFINGSRTMVPVRFAAQAFGIKVIPTYDENGATADILFNL